MILSKTFFSPFPKCPTKPDLFDEKIAEKLPSSSHKKFMITRIPSRLNFVPLSIY